MLEIFRQTARRFVLGRQGLWPGRRWRSKEGARQALREVEMVQMDPLQVVARSHDIVLWSRVLDYRPQHLDELLYRDRAFFDYGGALFICPMEELPYWRVEMNRRKSEKRYAEWADGKEALLEEVRAELRARGPLGNRDFTGRVRVESYRGRKDTGPALFYLWLTGELMTHSRRNHERVYYFREAVAPPELDWEASIAEAERFFARKIVAFDGLARARALAWPLRMRSGAQLHTLAAEMVEAGEFIPVAREGFREPFYALAADLPLLEAVQRGEVPGAWQPVETTTEEEVLFLAPLDIVSARGRAKTLFDFDYVWEVYKPAHLRRWGYYTMPVLYGDRLVARLDPKFDRANRTLILNGFWLEEESLGRDPAFAAALGRGLRRFGEFLGAENLDVSSIEPAELRKRVG